MLFQLFSMFCSECKSGVPEIKAVKNGSMITIIQSCEKCGSDCFKWQSQPFILGRYPAGNVLLSFASLAAGASISKICLVFKHMKLAIHDIRTFFRHQQMFVVPAILSHWEIYRDNLITAAGNEENLAICGDGRFESMGHSAKYGTHTIVSAKTHQKCSKHWPYTIAM